MICESPPGTRRQRSEAAVRATPERSCAFVVDPLFERSSNRHWHIAQCIANTSRKFSFAMGSTADPWLSLLKIHIGLRAAGDFHEPAVP
jgi:hypothetical protein